LSGKVLPNCQVEPRVTTEVANMAPGGRGRGGKFSKPTRGGQELMSASKILTFCRHISDM